MKRILILANNDVGLYKFRKELIIELLKENEVYIALPFGSYVEDFKLMGCNFIYTPINRRGTNPLIDLKLMFQYLKIVKKIKPYIVLTYTVKPNIFGGLACRISNTKYIANVTGLGTALENEGWMQKALVRMYRVAMKKASCIFFQNHSNQKFFLDNNIIGRKTKNIPGSGVNLDEHQLEEYPLFDDTYRILFVGRIMKAKGIEELLEVAKSINKKYPRVFFDLVGECEEDYTKTLNDFEEKGILKHHGLQGDVHSYIKNSHVTILPSHHEGLANVLLETASSGRPVLASKIPGCRETFDEGVSGYGFDVRNSSSLEEALIRFIELPYFQKRDMGLNGRKKIEKEFDRTIVVNAYLEEIESAIKETV